MRFALILLLVAACETPVTVAERAPDQPVCEPAVVEVVKEVPVATACPEDAPPEPAVPDGFPPEDEFEDPYEAGKEITARLVCSERKPDSHRCKNRDEDYRRLVIAKHWEKRVKNASHGGKAVSKLEDGTKIHDRDRPAGWKFWHSAVRAGWMNPDECVWHRVDPNVGHHPKELRWSVKWPFTASPLTRKQLSDWIAHSHDYERFVARGPNDGPPAYFYRVMSDRCFDPAQFERNDVAAVAHARRTMMLCAQAEADGVVCSYRYLRCTWGGARSRRRCAEREAAAEQGEPHG